MELYKYFNSFVKYFRNNCQTRWFYYKSTSVQEECLAEIFYHNKNKIFNKNKSSTLMMLTVRYNVTLTNKKSDKVGYINNHVIKSYH